jgi:hypothetical protein
MLASVQQVYGFLLKLVDWQSNAVRSARRGKAAKECCNIGIIEIET